MKTIQELGEEEDYTIVIDTSTAKSKVTVFKVEGITCMDCAQKFEQAVNKLPGVTKATLNAMTGKLTIEGEANLTAIQELGKEEDYTIVPETGKAAATQEPAARLGDAKSHIIRSFAGSCVPDGKVRRPVGWISSPVRCGHGSWRLG